MRIRSLIDLILLDTLKVGGGFEISVWRKKKIYTQYTIQFGVLSINVTDEKSIAQQRL